MSRETLSIYVAAHKEEQMDLPDGYKICQVNAEKSGQWPGSIVHDNDGVDNISLKNDRYCELTALYELWKNNDSEIKGLAHYRRFFAENDSPTFANYMHGVVSKAHIRKQALQKETIIRFLETNDIIVEYPRSPYIVNAYEDLLRFVFPEDIRALSDVISLYYPEYLESYKRVLQSTQISYLNMFIARKEVVSSYCEWLFDVLCKLENMIDIEEYDSQHKRIFGYLGEVLLNVWILKHELKIKHVFLLQTMTGSERLAALKKYDFYYSCYTKYLFLRRPSQFKYNKNRFEAARKACSDPYAHSLDDIYRNIKNLDDVLAYYSKQGNVTYSGKENIVVRGKACEYACTRVDYKEIYPSLQSNHRCLITVFVDDVEDIEAFIQNIHMKYDNKYTVNIRIITRNPHVKQYGDRVQEIYIYEMSLTKSLCRQGAEGNF